MFRKLRRAGPSPSRLPELAGRLSARPATWRAPSISVSWLRAAGVAPGGRASCSPQPPSSRDQYLGTCKQGASTIWAVRGRLCSVLSAAAGPRIAGLAWGLRARKNGGLHTGSSHPALRQSIQGPRQLSHHAGLRRRRPGGTPPAAQQPDSSRAATPDCWAPSAEAGRTPRGAGCRRGAACDGRGALEPGLV